MNLPTINDIQQTYLIIEKELSKITEQKGIDNPIDNPWKQSQITIEG